VARLVLGRFSPRRCPPFANRDGARIAHKQPCGPTHTHAVLCGPATRTMAAQPKRIKPRASCFNTFTGVSRGVPPVRAVHTATPWIMHKLRSGESGQATAKRWEMKDAVRWPRPRFQGGTARVNRTG
jgi:hypothetical protein